MVDIIKDLSILSTVPEYCLRDLLDKTIYSICHGIEESIIEKEKPTQIDIGIGKLLVNIEDNEIQYKFIPSSRLENLVKETVIEHKNPLEIELETALMNRIKSTYKELF